MVDESHACNTSLDWLFTYVCRALLATAPALANTDRRR